jgi:hypoxia up-regulated 1
LTMIVSDPLTLQIFGIRPAQPAFLPKEKKRIHKRTLTVETTYVGRVQPHSPEQKAASTAKILELAERDKERMMLQESRNTVESTIYKIKNTINDREEELSKVSTEQQREECMNLALAAQDWMDDEGYDADYATMQDKYASISLSFDKIMLRLKEKDARPAAVLALRKKLEEIEQLMVKWNTTKPQVTEEERNEVLAEVEIVRKWIDDNESKQATKMPHEEAAFLSVDVPGQNKAVERLVVRLGKKPKPKPIKKAENKTADANATDSTENATESSGEEAEETKEEEVEEKEEEVEAKEEEVEAKEEESKEESKDEENEL